MDKAIGNALAHLLGYFFAFSTSELVPPLIFVLSETIVQLVILPFKHDKVKGEFGLAVDGVLMPKIDIWAEKRFNEQLLALLLIVGQLALTDDAKKLKFLSFPFYESTPKRRICLHLSTREALKEQEYKEKYLSLLNDYKLQEKELQEMKEREKKQKEIQEEA